LNVPAVPKTSDALCPCESAAVLNPSLKNALCCALSRFVQVTVSPALIESGVGEYAKFWIVTAAVAA
jgi:hypothetical protein